MWHCDPTMNKGKVWIVSPPAEKPFPGVPVAGLSCGLRQKLEGSLKSSRWFFFSPFYCLNISAREPEIPKTRTVSTAVFVLFFLQVSLPLMFVRRPQTGSFIHLHARGGVCACTNVLMQRKKKQFNHATNRCRAAGPVRGAPASQLCLTWAVQ